MQEREWLPVSMHAEGIWKVFIDGISGEIYNISTGLSLKNIDMAKLLIKSVEANEDSYTFVKDRPGHDKRYGISNKKIKKLGWPNNKEHLSKEYIENYISDTALWFFNKYKI